MLAFGLCPGTRNEWIVLLSQETPLRRRCRAFGMLQDPHRKAPIESRDGHGEIRFIISSSEEARIKMMHARAG
jgi:hypothetical protein